MSPSNNKAHLLLVFTRYTPINYSRKETTAIDKIDLVKMNEKLRQEADYWHHKALDKDKLVSDMEIKRLI